MSEMIVGAIVSIFVTAVFGFLWRGLKKSLIRQYLENTIPKEILMGMYLSKAPWALRIIKEEILISTTVTINGSHAHFECISKLEEMGFIQVNQDKTSVYAMFYDLTITGKNAAQEMLEN